jgi:methionyl-tRNA formyltransferase
MRCSPPLGEGRGTVGAAPGNSPTSIACTVAVLCSRVPAMDLIFFGSGEFGLPSLRALVRTHRLRAVVTQPDRPAGRGGKLTPTPVGEFAAAELAGVPLLKPEDVNAPDVAARVQGFGAEAAVIIAFGQKLSPAVLPREELRAINLHASLLPRWRGAAPINAAILAGDPVTGNSVITIASRMDAGLILGQSTMPIDPLTTAGELHDKLSEQGPELMLGVLEQIQAGTVQGRAQDESQVTKARKLSKKDGYVDIGAGAEECRRRVHGLTPWPGVTVQFRGEPLKLCRVIPMKGDGAEEPGSLVDAAKGLVACGGDCLQVLEVQPSGGRRMTWEDFARGRRPQAGEVLRGGAAAC